MLMHLVLFAALAVKMRSSTFQRTSFKIRVEARPILGQVFYFLYFVFLGQGGWSRSLSSTGNALYAELRGRLLKVTSNR